MRHTIGQNERLYYMRPLTNRTTKKVEGDSEEIEENLQCNEGVYVLPIQWMADQLDKVEGKVRNLRVNIAGP